MLAIITKNGLRAMLVLLAVVATGCSHDMSDLETYVKEINNREGGRIKPLPQVEVYETYTYDASLMRSPFMPDSPVTVQRAGSGVRPVESRNREYLEQFSLDTLRMVGTLALGDNNFGLVQTSDGLIYRVSVGNHIGQNDGRITTINDQEIQLLEIISDGLGGYLERPAAVGLSD